MKKAFAIVLVLILFVIGYIAFEKYQNNKDTRKKFTFWTIQLKPIYEKEINKIISDFEEKHNDIKVVWVDIPIQEAQKRTLASILSDNPPDLINLNPDFSILLAQRGALEYFQEKETTQFNKNLIDKLKYQNNIYALPFYATSSVTIYNKELYDKCIKKDFIKSYDELYSISKDFKECANMPIFASSLNENDTLAKILNKYDIYDLKTEEQIKNAISVYSLLNNMYKKNYLPKDVLTINHREVVEKYMSNQAGIIVVGSNFINIIKENAKEVYNKSRIAPQLIGKNHKYDIALMNLIIPKKSQNKELAKEFALTLTNKENQLELSKLTNVLPANQEALDNEYFKNCPPDLSQQSRCISSMQLNNLVENDFGNNNKKVINELINKTLEELLLDNASDDILIKNKINSLANQIKKYQ